MTPPNDFAGTNRFEKRRLLGAGGMGAVYEVFDHQRQQRVALKTILRIDDAAALYRFKSEFRVLAHVVHPNLVRLYELIAAGDQWFYTMELVEGDTFLRYACARGPWAAADPVGDASTEDDAAGAADPDGGAPTDAASSGAAASEGGATTEAGTAGAADPRGDTPTAGGPAGVLPAGGPAGAADLSTRTLRRDLPADPDPIGPAGGASATRPYEPDLDATQAIGSKPAAAPHLGRLRAALKQLAEGLIALHDRGTLHRDIKPSNVLVTPEGRVVLLDFGLATDLKAQRDDRTEDQIVGTFSYMAPEQAAGGPLTTASDWYSVGVMLYQALTGRLPFGGSAFDLLRLKTQADPSPPCTLATGIPDDLNALCVDLLRRPPEQRPTGPEVLARLAGTAVAGGAAACAAPATPADRQYFVGRGPHMAALAEALAAARRGQMVAAFVRGRSGAGKSSLVQRFLDDLQAREAVVVLAGRCYEQESVAYKALDCVVDALSHFLRRLGRLEAERLLPRDIAALARVFPVLRRVAAVAEAPGRERETPEPQELRRRGFAALRELLARIGDRQPLVVYIDDLQWGDLDSAALLADLSRPPDPPVLLLIGCYRSEYEAVSPCLRMLLAPEADPAGFERRTIAVEALTPSECRDLVWSLIGQDDPAVRPLVELVVKESGGNPYFVYELVQFLTAGGELTESLATSGDFSLDEVLWRRILHLPREARLLMETLAVAGRPLRQADACHAAGRTADGFGALALLRVEHLVRGTGPGALDEVEPYHDRIRESVVKHLDPRTLKARHYGLAEVLEASGRADPETLAVHFEAAGVPGKAGQFYSAAAAEAAQTLAFDRAAKLYRRALDLLPPDDPGRRAIRTPWADALANAGRGLEAARAYQEAAVGASSAEVVELQRRAAYQFLISGHVDEGLAAFNLLLAQVGMELSSTPRRALLRALYYRALLRLRGVGFRERDAGQVAPEELLRIDICRSVAVGTSIVDVIEGAHWQAQALLRALRAGEPLRVALSLAWEAVHVACQGSATRRRTARLIRSAEAVAQRIGHPQALGMATLSAGCAAFLEGRYRAGLDLVDRAEAILRERCAGVVWELDTAHIFGLWSLIYLGRLGELRDRFALLFKEARERGDRYMEATIGTYIGSFARLAADDVEGARTQSEEAVRHWSQHGFHIQHLNRHYAHLYIDLYAGDGAAAWRRAREAQPAIDESLLLRVQQVRIDVVQLGGRSALAAAAAAVAADRQPLLQAAERSARRLDRERVPWAAALAVLIRAGVAAAGGDAPRAAARLAAAAAAFEALDMGLFAAAARRRLGELGGDNAGRALIAQADAWMADQSIRQPARMAACLAPGFPDP